MQRIALCVLFGGLILRKIQSPQRLTITLGVLAILYEIGMRLPRIVTHYGSFGQSFALQDNFARFVDTSLLPASMLYKVQGIPFDPEGLFTPLMALVTFLIGGLCFRLSGGGSRGRFKPTPTTVVATLAILGILLAFVEPVNKNLWTLPYTLMTGAAGVILLSFLEKLPLSGTGWQAHLFRPIIYMGINPLVIYVLSGIVAKTLALWKMPSGLSVKQTLFGYFSIAPLSPKVLSLGYSVVLLLAMAVLARFLSKRLVRV